MAANFRLILQSLEVRRHQESGSIFTPAGDEPYLMAVGFRSRFEVPDSTSVFWNRHLKEIGSNAKSGARLGIPGQMGVLDFPDVDPDAGPGFGPSRGRELIGAVVIVMEGDATPWWAVERGVDEFRAVLKNEVKSIYEAGNIGLLFTARKRIMDTMKPTWFDKFVRFVISVSDPDDEIGHELKFWQGRGIRPETFTLDFSGDGADYRVAGELSRL